MLHSDDWDFPGCDLLLEAMEALTVAHDTGRMTLASLGHGLALLASCVDAVAT